MYSKNGKIITIFLNCTWRVNQQYGRRTLNRAPIIGALLSEDELLRASGKDIFCRPKLNAKKALSEARMHM